MNLIREDRQTSSPKRYVLFLLLGWSAAVLLMAALTVLQARQHTQHLALGEAHTRANFEQALRLWVALHGGVYVPADQARPSDPVAPDLPEGEIVTPSGRRLILMSPNAILHQLEDLEVGSYQAMSRIVSLNPKRAEYTPDAWEKQALQVMASEAKDEVFEFTHLKETPTLRLLQPIRTQATCLKCHLNQGYQVGDLVGGLSIALPLKNFISHERSTLISQGAFLLGQWLLGSSLLLLGARHIQRDHQRRRQAEQSLAESEARYRSLVDNLPLGVYRVTPGARGKIITVNSTLVRMFGYANEAELLQAAVADLYANPQERKTFSDTLQEQGNISGVELELKKKDGSRFWGLVSAHVVRDEHTGEVFFDGTVEDITQRKVAQQAQAQAEAQAGRLAAKLRSITLAAGQIIALKNSPNLGEKVIQALQESARYYCTTLFLMREGKAAFEAGQGDYLPGHQPPPGMAIEPGRGVVGLVAKYGQPVLVSDALRDERFVPYAGLPLTRSELAVPIKNGTEILGVLDIQSAEPNAFDEADVEALTLLADQLAIALENARLFSETSHRTRELEILTRVSTALRSTISRGEIVHKILEQARQSLNAQAAAVILANAHGDLCVENANGLWAEMSGWKHLPQESPWAKVVSRGQPYVNNRLHQEPPHFAAESVEGLRAVACVPLVVQGEVVGALAIGSDTIFSDGDLRLLNGIADMLATTLQRARLYEQIQHYAEQMSAVNAIGRALTESLEFSEICMRLAQAVQDLYPEALAIFINRYDPSRQQLIWICGWQGNQPIDVSRLAPLPVAQAPSEAYAQALLTRQAQIVADAPQPRWRSQTGTLGPSSRSALYVPMFAKGESLDLIQVHSDLPSHFTSQDAELLTMVANTAAVAMENARLFAELKQQVQRLGALRAMDVAIRSSLDLRVTLNVLLDQVTSQLKVDAACVLLYNPHLHMLEFASGRGFHNPSDSASILRLDQSLAGRAVLERQHIYIPNLRANLGTQPLLQTSINETFVAYYAMPLIAKGEVKGVLELYHRHPLEPDSNWVEFLEALGDDAAIAIDNATLFNELQRSKIEITLAYDRTLEGWSRALELRDEETEGHSQRVTEMTLELGRALGMSEAELMHVRRGTLLHDIGKMGVPDEILRKPGPLTQEEWEIMRRHPLYAVELLSPIPYLKPALDIPAYHHERWDGSGYPNGLKGDQIPLAARIFAVVDVYDALLSDRPYRRAWSEDDVIAYLKQQAGHQFGPRVVEVFLRLRGK